MRIIPVDTNKVCSQCPTMKILPGQKTPKNPPKTTTNKKKNQKTPKNKQTNKQKTTNKQTNKQTHKKKKPTDGRMNITDYRGSLLPIWIKNLHGQDAAHREPLTSSLASASLFHICHSTSLLVPRFDVINYAAANHCNHEGAAGACHNDLLVGQVAKATAPNAEGLEFESRLRRDISGSSHTSDLIIGTPVATLPGALRYRVSVETGWPGVSILLLGEVESLVCSCYLGMCNCLNRSVPEIHSHVAGTLSNHQTTTPCSSSPA